MCSHRHDNGDNDPVTTVANRGTTCVAATETRRTAFKIVSEPYGKQKNKNSSRRKRGSKAAPERTCCFFYKTAPHGDADCERTGNATPVAERQRSHPLWLAEF